MISELSIFFKKIIGIVLFLLFLFANSSYAHRLIVFAEVDGLEIKISSYYSAGAKCKDCKVEIFSDNQKIKEGRTDEKGVFFFKMESPGSIKIVISDRMGHRAEYEIDKREMIKK